MPLTETFRRIRPSVVALGSRLAQTPVNQQPIFPVIFGTGFVVDSRGILMTNRHIADLLQNLPPTCAMAIVFPEAEVGEGEHAQPVLFRHVRAYNLMEEFHATGPFYGQLLPDVAFVQIDITELT